MSHSRQFYIDGTWVDPVGDRTLDVINPATEETCATIAMGTAADVDRAVAAAKSAFDSWSASTREERLTLLERIAAIYKRRAPEMAQAISDEMGAPLDFALESQAYTGTAHLEAIIEALREFPLEEHVGTALITHEPVGVAALITPWNWPMNQIASKVGPAIAAGCTMVLKPSEIAPLSGLLFAEIMHEAGTPPGVFNLVNGDGPGVGEALSAHPDVAVVSFTGSTRAGTAVARASAASVKRVLQELGGKSPNIVLRDADLRDAVSRGVKSCLGNSGQSCNAPTRMFVPRESLQDAMAIAGEVAASVVVGDPRQPGSTLGPVVSEVQFDKIQGLIQAGIDEGATLVCGGTGRPEGLTRGYYVKPTIFGNVTNTMTIAREEIFGPVLAILPYDTEEEAIAAANDTPYGLAAYIQSGDINHARALARKLRAGNVKINETGWSARVPFGGYKQSGNGREGGKWGLIDFLEVKAILGYDPS
ncbi:aldehyde dehydrogenase [Ameyamaea chiangmaiensis NBRC 103196]|uniref:aldehyde dehydrogenase (NAD(+)) n=1 Tax=Ameyamaea chiangmaiensis TaxID=442969 RepID=A0A850P668_9PROT|nr:aldehyde dehydrogenase family protein [Ameyamaea chiangmaiensis]MBS4074016.1 aldehyde dehydrogenase family protein [Ameyamaea chiangmaiensis]NVN39428.1 aldehyde dehydrogenase family protein [Ameyamaea chiangmaiensis]GBQ67595.1 aldehyde dehydrogenase [Ameyamaea chiangmaiensis NBRC 103196]